MWSLEEARHVQKTYFKKFAGLKFLNKIPDVSLPSCEPWFQFVIVLRHL
jgi:hypothetical protein